MTISRKTENEIIALASELNRSNKQDILKKINALLNSKGFTDATLKVSFTNVKNIFKNFTKDKRFLNKIKAPDLLIKKVNDEGDDNRRNRTDFTITQKDLLKIKKLKNSDNIYDRAIYLLFVSGRRTVEIISAKFTKIKNKIKVDGLVKRSKHKRTEDNSNIDTIISQNEFIKLVNKFQNDIEKQAIKSNSFNRSLNRRIKSEIGPMWKPHGLRGAYALYMYKFKNPDKLNKNGFITKVLNHQSDNSSLSYIGFLFGEHVTGINFE